MKRSLVVSGILAAGTVAVWTTIKRRRDGKPTSRFAAKRRAWWKAWMHHMLEKMPEDSPPRLIVSTLPRLSEQNEQILALLKEQTAVMRQLAAATHPRKPRPS